MSTLKQILFNRHKTIKLLIIAISLSIVLLIIRMLLTHSYYYLFLVWNLFLAVVPFAITAHIISLPKLNKYLMFLWFSAWLLFLPNAPYIVTDLLHIKFNNTNLLWLDILVISAFALNGLILFYYSLLEMKTVLLKHIQTHKVSFLINLIPFLSAFGVYLGRFLRYNSWEILSNPRVLILDIVIIINQPIKHKEAWLFTILFGSFLSIGFWIFKTVINSKTN
ncbi:DUF1361 domain-containing protein [Postechiella marina]|uniref:DUF1361 domain-containing protein n=1 Tax=Postechiella marina TaxID=943941 RepID=A0ABP8CEC5_9FLAO